MLLQSNKFKDLASFGQFGKKGVGYQIRELIVSIGEILGLNHNWHIAVVGLGHLGWALAHYQKFDSRFQISSHV